MDNYNEIVLSNGKAGGDLHDMIIPDFVVESTRFFNSNWHGGCGEKWELCTFPGQKVITESLSADFTCFKLIGRDK
jgi:hypothetical protein